MILGPLELHYHAEHGHSLLAVYYNADEILHLSTTKLILLQTYALSWWPFIRLSKAK